MKVKNNQMDMTSGPLLGKIFAFAFPIMLTNLIQISFNAADIFVVGRFAGDEALAAVGATTYIVNLVVNFFIGISVGAGVVISQAIGSANVRRLKLLVHTSMLFSVILGIFVAFLGLFISTPLLKLTGTPNNVIDLSDAYLKIYFLSVPAILVYNFGAGVLRAAGDSKRSLYILSVSGVLNVILNLVFVICFNMSARGVALATLVSNYLSAMIIVVFLFKDDADYKLYLKEIKINLKSLLDIIRIGLPMGIQSSLFALSSVFIQSAINGFGSNVVAGMSAASSIANFVSAVEGSAYSATLYFTGQNFGARKIKRIPKVALAATVYCALTTLPVSILSIVFKTPLLRLFTSNPESIAAGEIRMVLISGLLFLGGIMDIFIAVLRAMNRSVISMLISLFFNCIFRLIWVYTVFSLFPRLDVLLSVYPISWILATIFFFFYFLLVYKKELKD